MHKSFRLVAAASAAALLVLPAGVALAQGAPSGGTAAAPEPRASENKVAEGVAPETKAAPKKRKPAKMTRQQEVDRSIDQGTVPARYRNSVPKEYHQYIPFDKQ
jgi:hypothetical protein